MSADVVLVADSIAAEYLLQSAVGQAMKYVSLVQMTYVLALISARSQFCLLIIEIISGAAFPSSFNRPT